MVIIELSKQPSPQPLSQNRERDFDFREIGFYFQML